MLNAYTLIELGDAGDDGPGYSKDAALVGVVDEMIVGGVLRTNVITINLDASFPDDIGALIALADARELRAALDRAIAYVEAHGQTMTPLKRRGKAAAHV